MINQKKMKLLFEFVRYVFVGGLAFLIDSGTLFVCEEFLFTGNSGAELATSTAAGFITGLIANYVLSLIFVFKKSENKSNGKSLKGFFVFAIIGIIGLALTELGMYIGVFALNWHYVFTKIVVAAIVLIWNYIGRKIFVFNV